MVVVLLSSCKRTAPAKDPKRGQACTRSVNALAEPDVGGRGRVGASVTQDETDDAALMAAIAARGDRQAFTALFRRHAPRVRAHLAARGAPAGLADELTQEVMLAVWRKARL